MTRDQWISIFDNTNSLPTNNDLCSKVNNLHDQKDALVAAVIYHQRNNIRKLIDQQELNLTDDFFKDTDRSLGGPGSTRKE